MPEFPYVICRYFGDESGRFGSLMCSPTHCSARVRRPHDPQSERSVDFEFGSFDEDFNGMLLASRVPRRIDGYEQIYVADKYVLPRDVVVGDIVPLDIRHRILAFPPGEKPCQVGEHIKRKEEVASLGELCPRVSDRFGRVVEVPVLVRKVLATYPEPVYLVSIACMTGRCVDVSCILASGIDSLNVGQQVVLRGYEIPDVTCSSWGGPCSWDKDELNRPGDCSVLYVCQVKDYDPCALRLVTEDALLSEKESVPRWFGDEHGWFQELECFRPESSVEVRIGNGGEVRTMRYASAWNAEDTFLPMLDCLDEVQEMMDKENQPHYISGIEWVSVDEDIDCWPTNVVRGERVELKIVHGILEYLYARPGPARIQKLGILRPVLGDCFGHVYEVQGRIRERVKTYPRETLVVEVEQENGSRSCLECIASSELDDLPGDCKISMLGYELPYANPYKEGVEQNCKEICRLAGRPVFYICSWLAGCHIQGDRP